MYMISCKVGPSDQGTWAIFPISGSYLVSEDYFDLRLRNTSTAHSDNDTGFKKDMTLFFE